MDKSRQYIQMCKRSKEIQDLWKPKAGDFYANMDGDILCWVPDVSRTHVIKHGFSVESGQKVTRISPLVWMPKLDQLIELSQVMGTGFRDVSFIFYEWIKQPYNSNGQPASRYFGSLEQLWLAFIMNRKHVKRWLDGDWQATAVNHS